MKVRQEEEKVGLVKREMGQLTNELTTFEQEAQKQRKLIYKLDKARERADAEASEFQVGGWKEGMMCPLLVAFCSVWVGVQTKHARAYLFGVNHAKYASACMYRCRRCCCCCCCCFQGKYQQQLEQTKLKERTIEEMQRQIAELEAKLKQQENLYEAVRSDRNLYSKNLIESQDEIAEMKRKFKIMNHQIEQVCVCVLCVSVCVCACLCVCNHRLPRPATTKHQRS